VSSDLPVPDAHLPRGAPGPREPRLATTARRSGGHRGSVHRRQLSQRLWAESDDVHATSNLRSALWRLPKIAAGPLVSVTGPDVMLSPAVRRDLGDSERHAHALRDELEPDVQPGDVRLFEDDLLPDWTEEWLDIEQASHRQLRLHDLETHSRLLSSRGAYAAALTAALRAVRDDPLRESAHRAVVAVHLAEGYPAEALRQFHTYRRLLARELGLPPSPAIRGMVAHLLGRPSRHTAPAPASRRAAPRRALRLPLVLSCPVRPPPQRQTNERSPRRSCPPA